VRRDAGGRSFTMAVSFIATPQPNARTGTGAYEVEMLAFTRPRGNEDTGPGYTS
jgi:hypothetical protein